MRFRAYRLALFLFVLTANLSVADTYLEIETGAVWQSKNDVEIPPGEGSRLEFDKFKPGPFAHLRINAEYTWTPKHHFRLILAPFRVRVSGNVDKDIKYQGETYTSDEEIEVRYRFDSYRLGYYYAWLQEGHRFRFGGTAKIRAAKIQLLQNEKSESYSNLGFVPLFYIGYSKRLSEQWSVFSDMDFAAAPQGRAFDFTAKARYQADNEGQVGFGIRTLEGGADNDKVVTWSWFNYIVIDYAFNF